MGRYRKPIKGVSRRHFLRGAGAAVALPLLSACGDSAAPAVQVAREPGSIGTLENPFKHGVASGDPLSDRVILWTRVTPPSAASVPVLLQVYRDAALSDLAGSRNLIAVAAHDYTVKADFTGLSGGTTYYYRFSALGFDSPAGRTRTAPAGAAERLRFGVVSCSQYTNGWFNAYGALARRLDLDAIIHLGDYIYENEYVAIAGRDHVPPKEIVTLEDYRTRYAQYHQDPDLFELHRQFPMINIWDDHESTDNSYREGANNHQPDTEGDWLMRKAVAQRAFFEWLPIREAEPGNFNRIWRNLRYGDLLELVMLDTRLQKDDYVRDVPPEQCDPVIFDPTRTLLGAAQEQWFAETLRASTAQWKLIGTSIQVAQWKTAGAPNGGMTCGGVFLNADQWDGYDAARNKVYGVLAGDANHAAIDNALFIAGDIHSSWASDIAPDPNNPAAYNPVTGSGSLAVEWVCASVTSDFPVVPGTEQQIDGSAFMAANPAHKYINTSRRGYLLLDITAERASGEWWYVNTVQTRDPAEAFGVAWLCAADSAHMTFDAQTMAPANPPAPASGLPE